MKKNFLLLALSTLMFAVAGCNDSSASNGNSTSPSTSPSTSISPSASTSTSNSGSFIGTDGKVKFDNIVTLLTKLFSYEANNASGAQITNTLTNGTSITTTTEHVDVYNSLIPSSASKGTVVRTINGKEDKSDTFVKRNAVVNEKYAVEVNGLATVQTYPMFAQIVDYENENMGGTAYIDSAVKYFVVDSDKDATDGGLVEGQYVTTTDMLGLASPRVSSTLYSYLSTYILNNVYAQQVGVDSFEYRTLASGNIAYSCIVGYSIEGDLDDTQFHSVNIQFITNADQTKLVSGEISYVHADMREGEDDDAYVNEIHWAATLEYNTRKEVPSDGINVEDYFLQNISDVDVYTRANNNATVDPDNIPLSNSYNYLFARAKTYQPEKAVDISIAGAGSSNQEVVSFSDDGYFEIVGAGTTTLSFVYFGKDADGVYREKTFNKTVTVKTPNPESIRFTVIKPSIADNTLQIGQKYTFSVYALPLTASQDIIMSNSNPDVLNASIDENNNVTVTALASGQTTLTFKITDFESVTTSITFTVASADVDLATVITQKTYVCDQSIYNYTYTLKFNADGTGSRIEHHTDTNEDYTDTFTYTISGNKITFTSWSDGTQREFETGIITQEGNKITCSCESAMKDYQFLAQ